MLGEGRLRRETVKGFPLFVSGEARAFRERRDSGDTRAEGERRDYAPPAGAKAVMRQPLPLFTKHAACSTGLLTCSSRTKPSRLRWRMRTHFWRASALSS